MSNIIKENCNHSLVFIFTWADEVRNLLAKPRLRVSPPPLFPLVSHIRNVQAGKARDTIKRVRRVGEKEKQTCAKMATIGKSENNH